jgi:LuxR family maltose regulon positive regulatory protein
MFAQFGELGVPIAELSMARVKISQGDWESGQEYLAKARLHAQSPEAGRLNERLVNGLQARLWIMRGELGLAEQWARDSGLITRSIRDILASAGQHAAGSEFVHHDYLTLARLYLAQNKPAAALEVIDSLLAVAGALGYMRRVIQILILKSLALQQMRQGPLAVDALGQALTLAEPEGTLRVFLDEGELIVPILYQAVERGIAVNYARKILAVFPHSGYFAAAQGEKKSQVDRLLEPLSDREIEVLVLIATGLSNREISARLHISLSTVKGHSANIYGKLGVNSRVQAISEATRLGILTRRGVD